MSHHRFIPNSCGAERSADARLRGLAMEALCNAIPTGAVALDARARLVFANREGVDLLHRWNTASQPPRRSSSEGNVLPDEILAACEHLRHGGVTNSATRARPKFGGRLFVRHPNNSNLSAVVALDRSSRDRRIAVFCVLLQDRLKDSLAAGRRDQLAMLTIAERRVAKLVAEGMRNRDIARSLGKSVTTVKSQLGAIFSKLEIGSRTQLAALLRSA